MVSISKRALLLAGLLGAGAVVLALVLKKDGNAADEGAISILGPTEGANEAMNREFATASNTQQAQPNALVKVDLHIWRTDDVREVAPGTRTGILGAGKTAVLRGELADDRGPLGGATVKILHGLNEGLSTTANANGVFEFPPLYPGVSILEVEAPRQPKIRREVRLRANREELFNFTYQQAGNIHGMVVDEQGKPIQGASAEIDGVVTTTDRDGAFFFNGVVPGECILYLSAQGREYRKEGIALRAGQALVYDVNRFVLRKSEPLTVAFDPLPISPRPPKVLILPGEQVFDRTFPYEKIGVVSPRPGDDTVKIEGIAVGEWHQVRVYSDAGTASPSMRPVILKEGDTNLSRAAFSFGWKFPVSGTVMGDGRPLSGAKIRIESSDMSRGMQELLTNCGGIDHVIVPMLPFVRKETTTDGNGNFQVEASEIPPPAAVVVEAPGYARRVIPIQSGAPRKLGNITLQKSAKDGSAKLVVQFQDDARHEVCLTIDGRAQAPQLVPAGARMQWTQIAPGTYRVRARSGGTVALDKWIEIAPGENSLAVPAVIELQGPGDDEETVDAEPPASEPEDR
jgi:hypothetical protein